MRQTLLGIEKGSSKDYFELSRVRVKRRQLYILINENYQLVHGQALP